MRLCRAHTSFQFSQSKILRRGAGGCFRPFFSKGSPPCPQSAVLEGCPQAPVAPARHPLRIETPAAAAPPGCVRSETASRPHSCPYAASSSDIYHESIPSSKRTYSPVARCGRLPFSLSLNFQLLQTKKEGGNLAPSS